MSFRSREKTGDAATWMFPGGDMDSLLAKYMRDRSQSAAAHEPDGAVRRLTETSPEITASVASAVCAASKSLETTCLLPALSSDREFFAAGHGRSRAPREGVRPGAGDQAHARPHGCLWRIAISSSSHDMKHCYIPFFMLLIPK